MKFFLLVFVIGTSGLAVRAETNTSAQAGD